MNHEYVLYMWAKPDTHKGKDGAYMYAANPCQNSIVGVSITPAGPWKNSFGEEEALESSIRYVVMSISTGKAFVDDDVPYISIVKYLN